MLLSGGYWCQGCPVRNGLFPDTVKPHASLYCARFLEIDGLYLHQVVFSQQLFWTISSSPLNYKFKNKQLLPYSDQFRLFVFGNYFSSSYTIRLPPNGHEPFPDFEELPLMPPVATIRDYDMLSFAGRVGIVGGSGGGGGV